MQLIPKRNYDNRSNFWNWKSYDFQCSNNLTLTENINLNDSGSSSSNLQNRASTPRLHVGQKTEKYPPIVERTPPPNQMSIDIAGEPTRLDTLFGDTKIPAPIIVPTMILTPE